MRLLGTFVPNTTVQRFPMLQSGESVTVTGEGGADKPGMLAALKQGQDDLLERLRAAQEQQRRLSYG